MRNQVVLRQWAILRELKRSPCALDDLARATRCSTRTVRRDLNALQEAHVPIVQDGETKRYTLMRQAPCPACGRAA